jgi:hypothetical protein
MFVRDHRRSYWRAWTAVHVFRRGIRPAVPAIEWDLATDEEAIWEAAREVSGVVSRSALDERSERSDLMINGSV